MVRVNTKFEISIYLPDDHDIGELEEEKFDFDIMEGEEFFVEVEEVPVDPYVIIPTDHGTYFYDLKGNRLNDIPNHRKTENTELHESLAHQYSRIAKGLATAKEEHGLSNRQLAKILIENGYPAKSINGLAGQISLIMRGERKPANEKVWDETLRNAFPIRRERLRVWRI